MTRLAPSTEVWQAWLLAHSHISPSCYWGHSTAMRRAHIDSTLLLCSRLWCLIQVAAITIPHMPGMSVYQEFSCFLSWRWFGSSTQAWMPTYVSILRIPQMIWVWRATVEWYWQGKTEKLGEKPVPVPLCPPQIPHGLTRARTRASVVRGRRLTTWATARPNSLVSARGSVVHSNQFIEFSGAFINICKHDATVGIVSNKWVAEMHILSDGMSQCFPLTER
jgi:hypothetical protein